MRGGLEAARARSARALAGAQPPGLPALRLAARPDVLLLVLGAVILTFVWRFQNVVPGAQLVRPTLLLGLAILVAAVRISPTHALRRLRSAILGLLVLLLVVVAVGIPFALDSSGAMRYMVTWLAPGALLAALIAIAVRGVDDVEWLVFVTLVGAAVYLAILFARGGLNAMTDRAATVFYDRNDLSLVLVALLPAALHFTRAGEPLLRRLFAVACFLVFVFTIVRGGSRGGSVGLIVVMGYVLLTFPTLPRRARIWTTAAAALLLATAGPAYWERMRSMFQPESDYNWSGRTYGRGQLWRRGLGYIRERPLVGVGASGFPVAERELSPVARRRLMVGRPFETLNAHNIFMQVGAELGLPGLAVFVALLVQMGRALSRLRKRYGSDPRLAGAAHVLLAALLGYVVCGFFLSAAYFPFLYLLIGLVAGVVAVAGPEVAAVRSGRAHTPSDSRPTGALPPYELPTPARW